MPRPFSSPLALEHFFSACERGDLHSVRQTLETHPEWATSAFRKASKKIGGETSALFLASEHGHVEIVRALIEHCDARCFECIEAVHSPLHAAAFYGHLDCLLALLPHSNPFETDQVFRIPLHWAAQAGHPDCVEALLSPAGAQALDANHATPLMLACASGESECVELLLPLSDPNTQNVHGYNALTLAVRFGPSLVCSNAIIRRLLPVSQQPVTHEGTCALTLAARYGPFDLVGELAAAGDIHRTMPTGNGSDTETVLQLLLHKAPASAVHAFLAHCPEDYLTQHLPDSISVAKMQGKTEILAVLLDAFPLSALPAALQQETDATVAELLSQTLARKERATLQTIGVNPDENASPGEPSVASPKGPRRRL